MDALIAFCERLEVLAVIYGMVIAVVILLLTRK